MVFVFYAPTDLHIAINCNERVTTCFKFFKSCCFWLFQAKVLDLFESCVSGLPAVAVVRPVAPKA